MQITVNHTLTPERIADMMVTAVEGNDMTRAWCWGIRLGGALAGKEGEYRNEDRTPWYSNPALYARDDFALRIFEIEDESEDIEFSEDDDGDELPTTNCKVHEIDAAGFIKGVQIMATKYPEHFADIIAENDDAITGDVFLQCIALNEIVYG